MRDQKNASLHFTCIIQLFYNLYAKTDLVVQMVSVVIGKTGHADILDVGKNAGIIEGTGISVCKR